MLRFLRIQHLAVIDRLELEFEPGLTVLTGETGAGKSILVGAVGLLVGGRASTELVRTGEEQAVVEAIFVHPGGDELIVRREISAQGRSRAFVNGTLVTSTALRETCGPLVDHKPSVWPPWHATPRPEGRRPIPARRSRRGRLEAKVQSRW